MRVKSVVINADLDWDFSRNVWLHALDTYRADSNTLFWTLEPDSTPENATAAFWGGFPEYYHRYPDSLVEECAELANGLVATENSRLAVVVVLSKADFLAFGASHAPRIPDLSQAGQTALKGLARLLEEVNRQSAHAQNAVSEARTRLWSAIAVRRIGDDRRDGETALQVLSRIWPENCRLNTVYMLSEGRVQDEAAATDERTFLKLRLVMELMANSQPDTEMHDAWRQFRGDSGTGLAARRSIYWVKMPEASPPAGLASDCLRRLLVDWSADIDARTDGEPNRAVKERVETLVQDLQPLDTAAIKSRLTSDRSAPSRNAGENGASGNIDAAIDAFDRRTRRRWLYSKATLARIVEEKTSFRGHLHAYAQARLESEQRELETQTKDAHAKRLDALESLREISISAGEKGKREIEGPLGLLRGRLTDATARAAAARARLREHLRAQDRHAKTLDEAFDRLANAERHLLKPSAVGTFILLLVIFVLPALLYNSLYNDTAALAGTASADSLAYWRHALSYLQWIVSPIFGLAALIGIIVAYRLRRLRTMEQSRLVSELQAAARRVDDISAERVAVKAARDDAAILQLAIEQMEPRENWGDPRNRQYFVNGILRHRRPPPRTDIPEVDGKLQTLREDARHLLGQGVSDAERVQSFLASHGFTLEGQLSVSASSLGNAANLRYGNRFSWRAKLELAEPGQ